MDNNHYHPGYLVSLAILTILLFSAFIFQLFVNRDLQHQLDMIHKSHIFIHEGQDVIISYDAIVAVCEDNKIKLGDNLKYTGLELYVPVAVNHPTEETFTITDALGRSYDILIWVNVDEHNVFSATPFDCTYAGSLTTP